MASNVTNSSNTKKSASDVDNNASQSNKGKGKEGEDIGDQNIEEVVTDEEDEENSEEEESDEEVEDNFEEIDPKAIMPQGRRTRGIKVDYSSKEALEKAGLRERDDLKDDDDDDDGDVEMRD